MGRKIALGFLGLVCGGLVLLIIYNLVVPGEESSSTVTRALITLAGGSIAFGKVISQKNRQGGQVVPFRVAMIILMILCGLVVIGTAGLHLTLNGETPLSQPSIMMIIAGGMGLVVARLLYNKKPSFHLYESAYGEIIQGVFENAPDKRNQLHKGLTLLDDDHFQPAIHVFTSLVNQCVTDRESGVVHFFLAVCHRQLGLIEKAMAYYHQALEFNPKIDKAWSNLGMLYQHKGNDKTAVEYYLKAIACNPKNPMPYNNLAHYYVKKGDVIKAIDYAQQALAIKANLYQSLNALALAYAIQGNRDMMEKYYRQSVLSGCDDPKGLRGTLEMMYNTSVVKATMPSTYAGEKPTLECWEEALANGEEVSYTQKDVDRCNYILDDYLADLNALGEKGSEGDILKCVEKAVLMLNKLAQTHEDMIETDEREDLCAFILYHAKQKGWPNDDDITEQWREW